jgi:hypothetical protein
MSKPLISRTIFTNSRWIAVLIGILPLLAGANVMAIEEPTYEVVKSYPEFELRRYEPFLVAETEVDGDFDEVGSQAFRILAAYIFGENKSQAKMEMTAPVNQRPAAGEGEKMAMTAPVSQRSKGSGGSDTFVLSFVMPSGYSLDSLPVPLDPRVLLREEPAKLMAVRSYSGRWTEANYRENESLLLAAVKKAGLTPVAAPVYARYNSPFSLPFLRRNEAMVEVSGVE